MHLILESSLKFRFLDYHCSHQQLLIRGENTVEGENIDIAFEGTGFLTCPTSFEGVKLFLLEDEDVEASAFSKLPFTKYFLIETNNNQYYIQAAVVRIFKNNLLPFERTLMSGRGQERLLYRSK